MRRDKWLAGLVGVLLSTLAAFAAVMCLQSAFSLPVNVRQVLLGCAVSAVLFSAGFSLKWWYIPLLLIAPLAGYLWFNGSLSDSLERVIYELSLCYDRAYGTGVYYWSQQPPAGETTMALCALGCVIAFVTAWSVCRRKPAIWAVLTALLPLTACFVVTDRVPQAEYLYLLLLGLSVLLLTGLSRRKVPAKANLLTLLIALPVALGLLILFRAVPQETYQGQQRADTILTKVQQWVEDVGTSTGITGTGGIDQIVELDEAGRLLQTHTPVMTVHAEEVNGTIYLRKQGFQMYDGRAWYNEYGNDIYRWVQWEQMDKTGVVEITTRGQHLMKFVPYYAKEQIRDPKGNASYLTVEVNSLGITENTQQEYGYTFFMYQLKTDAPSASTHSEGGLQFPVGSYSPDAILLPAATAIWAESVVYPLIEGKETVREQAEAIGDYVRGLAGYSRNTPRMPDDHTDFAKWFVTEAETGYCVHFATTAAVLLRAAGIQAQYVEGYTVRVQDGYAVTVYEDQAHAWVEYYDPAVGWRILECTPAEGIPGYVHVQENETPTEPQQQQTPQQVPQQTPQQNDPITEKQPVSTVLWWILGVVAAVALVWLQWRLRLRLKKHRLTKGNANQQALQLWRELVRTSRRLKCRPAQQWHSLAQKAKFSQHVISVQELAILTAALEDQQKQLKGKTWYWQPVYTLVFAIY